MVTKTIKIGKNKPNNITKSQSANKKIKKIADKKTKIVNKSLIKKDKILIKKDMTIGEILEKCPASAIIMASFGLHCVGCAISTSESLEDGCKSHMLSDEDICKLVDDINKEIQNNK